MNYSNRPQESLVLTDTIIEKIMKQCGIENTTVIFKGKDYFVSIVKIHKHGFDIALHNIVKPINEQDKLQIVININGKRYFLSVMVTSIILQGEKVIVKTKIVGKVNLEVRGKLDDIMEKLRFMYNRQQIRIGITDDILSHFSINPKGIILFPRKEYIAYIKNISSNGINFVTTKNFMDEESEQYNMSINFNNPAENITVTGQVLRKNIVQMLDEEFTHVAMKIGENIHLNKRIIDYFKSVGLIKSALTVG